MPDRITQLTVRGLRTLDDVTLPLGGVTALIGDNGSGKTSLIEALELLSRLPESGSSITDQVRDWHGNFNEVLRYGSARLLLGIRIEGDEPTLDYSIELLPTANALSATVGRESISTPEKGSWMMRVDSRVSFNNVPSSALSPSILGSETIGNNASVVAAYGQPPAGTALGRVRAQLEGLRVHVPFDVRPTWAAQDKDGKPATRRPAVLDTARRLERYGANLANCYHSLVSDPRLRDQVVDDLRVGLDLDITAVSTPVAGRGYVDLALSLRGRTQLVYASMLSSGQLAYMAFVALARLPAATSMIAFDEPDVHLHPGLLTRVSWLFQELSERGPVLLTTHSDLLLDTLEDPERQVIVCSLDDRNATRLFRMDPNQLSDWRSKYRGVGELRQRGLTPSVFVEPVLGTP